MSCFNFCLFCSFYRLWMYRTGGKTDTIKPKCIQCTWVVSSVLWKQGLCYSFRQRTPSIAMLLFLWREQGQLGIAATVEWRTHDLMNLVDKVIYFLGKIIVKQALLQLFLVKLKLEKVELFMNIHCSCRATFLIPKSQVITLVCWLSIIPVPYIFLI